MNATGLPTPPKGRVWSDIGNDLEASLDGKRAEYVDIRAKGSDTHIFMSRESLKKALGILMGAHCNE